MTKFQTFKELICSEHFYKTEQKAHFQVLPLRTLLHTKTR